MYILIMFIWVQSAGHLVVNQPRENIVPISYQTEVMCDEASKLMPLVIPSDINVEYSWQSPKCVFVEKPI